MHRGTAHENGRKGGRPRTGKLTQRHDGCLVNARFSFSALTLLPESRKRQDFARQDSCLCSGRFVRPVRRIKRCCRFVAQHALPKFAHVAEGLQNAVHVACVTDVVQPGNATCVPLSPAICDAPPLDHSGRPVPDRPALCGSCA